jgi:hypothetical protein
MNATQDRRIDPLATATPRQAQYIWDLAAQVPIEIAVQASTWMNEQARVMGGPLNSTQVHNLIERLKANRQALPSVQPVDVAPGRYALRVDGVVHFYKVDKPAKGPHAGRTFVTEQAGDNLHPVRGYRAQDVLREIAVDVDAAHTLYGTELGQCWRCGRTLTDETSRELGIGPDCRSKI